MFSGFFSSSATSFPGSLFYASIAVEKTTMEAEKRDPGNEVGSSVGSGYVAAKVRSQVKSIFTLKKKKG